MKDENKNNFQKKIKAPRLTGKISPEAKEALQNAAQAIGRAFKRASEANTKEMTEAAKKLDELKRDVEVEKAITHHEDVMSNILGRPCRVMAAGEEAEKRKVAAAIYAKDCKNTPIKDMELRSQEILNDLRRMPSEEYEKLKVQFLDEDKELSKLEWWDIKLRHAEIEREEEELAAAIWNRDFVNFPADEMEPRIAVILDGLRSMTPDQYQRMKNVYLRESELTEPEISVLATRICECDGSVNYEAAVERVGKMDRRKYNSNMDFYTGINKATLSDPKHKPLTAGEIYELADLLHEFDPEREYKDIWENVAKMSREEYDKNVEWYIGEKKDNGEFNGLQVHVDKLGPDLNKIQADQMLSKDMGYVHSKMASAELRHTPRFPQPDLKQMEAMAVMGGGSVSRERRIGENSVARKCPANEISVNGGDTVRIHTRVSVNSGDVAARMRRDIEKSIEGHEACVKELKEQLKYIK